ncbi:AGE family epimerase/isomerase [Methylocapsa polymorpha]|uniref:AGE family epimerase/isomerase n=1 Tax=Methylocapsa polymorpha TaxID=3080828 RepID=A0ABZ0HRT1_9HYPH|nr:AGE family epimerase/isomerase [Methylocapsa sp. RX1]
MGRACALSGLLRDWLTSKALPLWSTVGFDRRRGHFQERLDWNGEPVVAVARRAMVQARQIYVFAHAAHLGWFPEGAAFAETAMRSLLRDFRDPSSRSGGFAFSVDSEGAVVSEIRDAYAHAFILFAIAWLHRLNGDPNLIAVADDTIAFIDASLEDPVHCGLFDSFPVVDRGKRQNPHMHLLEAYLALEVSAPGRGYLDRAKKLVEIFQSRLFRAEQGVLLEYFAEDWSDHPDPTTRRTFEPGHHFEWVWLLREFENLSGEDMGPWADRLMLSASENGVGENGLVFDELATDMSVLKQSHRIWPHAEGAKAAVASRLLFREGAAPRFASTMISALLDHFLDKPFAGGWIDHIGADGKPLVDYVPASSLYHVFFAAAELTRAFPPYQKAST